MAEKQTIDLRDESLRSEEEDSFGDEMDDFIVEEDSAKGQQLKDSYRRPPDTLDPGTGPTSTFRPFVL